MPGNRAEARPLSGLEQKDLNRASGTAARKDLNIMRKRSYGTLLGTGLAATVLAVGLFATPSLATTATT
jgi:hypothetical protein